MCAGLAEHLRVPVLWVRITFAAGILANGLSVIAYAILWRFMPLAAATERDQQVTTGRNKELAQAAAIGVVVLGVVSGPCRKSMTGFT